MNLRQSRRSANYRLVADDLVLDIFRIGYDDFSSGLLTPKKLLYRSVYRVYQPKGLSKSQIDQVILLITKSTWFEDRGDFINLTYRGIEIYLGFTQSYESKRHANDASRWAKRTYLIAAISMIVCLIGAMLTLIGILLSK